MQAAAVVVGWLVIAGSCIRSLPQILRILKNRRCAGGGPSSQQAAAQLRHSECTPDLHGDCELPAASTAVVYVCSVEGLSLTSFATEACTLTVQCAYNLTYGYAFSTYGDVVMCQLQTVAVIGLMFMYG